MKKHKPKKLNKKHHAGHHKKNKTYHAAYWPYLPLLVLVIGLFAFAYLKSPSGPNVLAFATEMSQNSLLQETNRQRENNGSTPLQINEQLSEAARLKAEDMARRNYWSHQTPEGEQPWVFVEETGYRYIKAGENLAYGFQTSEQTVNGWMKSESHRDNMLDPDFSEVGFGYVNAVNFQNSSEETIIVALYAQPVPAAADSPADLANDTADSETETVIAMSVPQTNENVKSITRIESLIGGQFAWATFSLGIISGTAATGLFVSHGIRFRRLLKRSEAFILHHPLLDMTLVSLLLLAAFLAANVGYIL